MTKGTNTEIDEQGMMNNEFYFVNRNSAIAIRHSPMKWLANLYRDLTY